MDDEGKIILKKVQMDILAKPRMALVNALHDWDRQWMQAYYALVSGVDPDAPSDADQAQDLGAIAQLRQWWELLEQQWMSLEDEADPRFFPGVLLEDE